jgi:hypothetical protein
LTNEKTPQSTEENPPEKLFSSHIFLFPFKWEKRDLPEKVLFTNQVRLEQIDSFFPVKNQWIESPYKIDTLANYNEYNYFYDYVREVQYDTSNNSKPLENSPLYSKQAGNEQMLRHFEYQLNGKSAFYRIETNDPTDEYNRKVYELEVESILLQFYYTGVGILSFHLNNRKENQAGEKDILYINQYGRRIFPPFFGIPDKLVGLPALYEQKDFQNHLPTGKELAYSISLEIEGLDPLKEDWEHYTQYSKFEKDPFYLPQFISGLLPAGFVGSSSTMKLSPVLDDRMFVVSWYGNNTITWRLYQSQENGSIVIPPGRDASPKENFLLDPWWYQYLFVDANGVTCQNELMQTELVRQATNARWAKYGTYYGVTDYSFVLLTSDLPTLQQEYVRAAFLVTHLRTIYYKLAELVLLQRASVQRFSEEVTLISRLDGEEEKDSTLSLRVESLYKQYIRFVNKIYFREVTAQVQGRELYQLLHHQCGLEKHVKDLDGEINELHNYVQQVQERQRNDRLEVLTILGAVFLPPSLIFGVFGVSILGALDDQCLPRVLLGISGIALLTAGCSYLAYRGQQLFKWLAGLFLVFGLFGPWMMVYFFPECKAKPSPEQSKLLIILEEIQSIEQRLDEYKLETPVPVVIDTLKNASDGK